MESWEKWKGEKLGRFAVGEHVGDEGGDEGGGVRMARQGGVSCGEVLAAEGGLEERDEERGSLLCFG